MPHVVRQRGAETACLSISVPIRALSSEGSVVVSCTSVTVTLPKKVNALSRVFALLSTRAVKCRDGEIVVCGLSRFCSAAVTLLRRLRRRNVLHNNVTSFVSVTCALSSVRGYLSSLPSVRKGMWFYGSLRQLCCRGSCCHSIVPLLHYRHRLHAIQRERSMCH